MLNMPMDKIQFLEQYKDLVHTAKAGGAKQTNCFLLVSKIDEWIQKSCLYYKKIGRNLLLIVDAGPFYRCYYYFSEDCLPETIMLDKDAVIEFPYNGEMNQNQLSQVSIIEGMGFRLGRESALMRADVSSVETHQMVKSMCYPAFSDEVATIADMLLSAFNPLYSFLPTKDELLNMIKKERVFVIRQQNKIIGVLVSNVDRKIAMIDQLVVDSDYRGNGFGGMLIDYYHNRFRTCVSAFQHWVDCTNRTAISLYKRFGYSFTLRKANEYIYIKKENENGKNKRKAYVDS